jgi:predicted anti-sigma-YlaC factor YlaD
VNCEEVRDQLGDYLDDEALSDLCRAIDEHLKHCRECRIEVDSLRKTILLYHSDQPTELPAATRAQLQQSLAILYRQATGQQPVL